MKVATIKELVEWTTSNDKTSNYCVGTFSKDANKQFILKELLNAPVDKETMTSRSYLNKHKTDKAIFNPSSIGYSEAFIQIFTNKKLDDYDFRDSKIPYKLESIEETTKDGEGVNCYTFSIDTKTSEV